MKEVASFSGNRTSWPYSQINVIHFFIPCFVQVSMGLLILFSSQNLVLHVLSFVHFLSLLLCIDFTQHHAYYMLCHDHPKTVYWIQFRYNYFCGVYCNIYVVRYQRGRRNILIRMAARVSHISYALDFEVREIVIIKYDSQIRGFKLSHIFRRCLASAASTENWLEVRENREKYYVII